VLHAATAATAAAAAAAAKSMEHIRVLQTHGSSTCCLANGSVVACVIALVLRYQVLGDA
jgi:hypothetical protein